MNNTILTQIPAQSTFEYPSIIISTVKFINEAMYSGVFKGRRAMHLPRAPPFWGPPLEVLRT